MLTPVPVDLWTPAPPEGAPWETVVECPVAECGGTGYINTYWARHQSCMFCAPTRRAMTQRQEAGR